MLGTDSHRCNSGQIRRRTVRRLNELAIQVDAAKVGRSILHERIVIPLPFKLRIVLGEIADAHIPAATSGVSRVPIDSAISPGRMRKRDAVPAIEGLESCVVTWVLGRVTEVPERQSNLVVRTNGIVSTSGIDDDHAARHVAH